MITSVVNRCCVLLLVMQQLPPCAENELEMVVRTATVHWCMPLCPNVMCCRSQREQLSANCSVEVLNKQQLVRLLLCVELLLFSNAVRTIKRALCLVLQGGLLQRDSNLSTC